MVKSKIPPRRLPSKESRYMGMAMWIASFSKDPATQVGAVVISEQNEFVGWGYNGPPKKNKHDVEWEAPEKYYWIKHAVENALDYSLKSTQYCILYTTAIPCARCMLRVCDSGIKRVVYFPFLSHAKSSLHSNENDLPKIQEVAKSANIQLVEFTGNLNWMRDRILSMESMGIF